MIFIEKPAAGVPEQMHASEAEGEATQDEHDSASFHPKTKNLDLKSEGPNVPRWIYPCQSDSQDDEGDLRGQELPFQWVAC